MKHFSYRAVDLHGHIVRGQLMALNDSDLDHQLSQIGLQLLTCRNANGRFIRSGRATSRRELINFCFHLEQTQNAGLPLIEALQDLRDSTENDPFRNVLAALTLTIENGKCLSDAMEDFPETFDEVFVNLVRAGEKSGELGTVLGKMTETLKWQDELAAHAKKLIIYPAFVGTVVIGVILFLMMYVVPQMTDFLESMDKEMPIYTIALIETSRFIAAHWYWLLTVPFVAAVMLKSALKRSKRLRYAVDALKLRCWLIGPVLEKIIMNRFATYFQIMYASGITIIEALQTARGLAGNEVIGEALGKVTHYVAEGNSLSAGAARAGVFPQLVVRMIKMGEDIGQLEDALGNVSYFYSREIDDAVEKLQSLIEPVMTIVLGLLLGWVMLSVLSPIYDTIADIGF